MIISRAETVSELVGESGLPRDGPDMLGGPIGCQLDIGLVLVVSKE